VLRTFKLTVAYDGTEFAGWQVQPHQQSIQGLLELAVYQTTNQSVRVIGSGRTDAGVHAIAQVASLTLSQWNHSAESLGRAINAKLPETIVVKEVVDAPQDFHAIRDAIGKRYRYQLQVGGQRDVFEFPFRWRLHGHIDLDRMAEAAALFVGQHDFAGFQATGAERTSTVRNVRACELIVQSTSTSEATHVAIEVEADGFLYNMVRNIVGTLVEVGRGKHSPQWVSELLVAGNRDLAGPTAPAHGLFLLRVDYLPFVS
jgi:tRNA pseudouridine38-40 synthase